MVTYKLIPSMSTKFFNSSKFVDHLGLDLFLTNLDNLQCNCNSSPFTVRHHKHVEQGIYELLKPIF